MGEIITWVRTLIEAGTADYTVAGSAHWTDDQIQQQLDAHRRDHHRVAIHPEGRYVGGSTEYTEYYLPHVWVEGTASGTAAWYLHDGNGSAMTGYTLDTATGKITFAADQQGTVAYATYRAYDLERTAATIWRAKASHYAAQYDVKTDNHDLKRSQMYKHALNQAAYFAKHSKSVTRKLRRTDVIGR